MSATANLPSNIFLLPAVMEISDRRNSGQAPVCLPSRPTSKLGRKEAELIAARDSFHLATIGENSWPYTQYRRGPKGFLRILDSTTLALPDLRANRHHMTENVVLFLMDHSSRERLKIWATTETSEDPMVIEQLADRSYATIDRAFLFHVHALEWNGQEKIVPFGLGEKHLLTSDQTIPFPTKPFISEGRVAYAS